MQTIHTHEKSLTLQQEAYISDCGEYYQAQAKDTEGKEFLIKWPIINSDPENCDDESLMCDWGNPTIIQELI